MGNSILMKRISNEDVVKRLKVICKESNIKITDEALNIIAILSEGAMRDAISILERCTGEKSGEIDENYVRELVGIPQNRQIYEVVKGIIEYKCENVLKITNDIINQGKDVDNFLWEIIKYIKDILVFKSSKSLDIYNKEEKEQISKLAEVVSKERLLQLIYDLSELANNIKWSSQKVIMFQTGMIKACIDLEVKNDVTTKIPQKIDKEQLSGNTNKISIEKNVAKESNVHPKIESDKKISNGENIPYWEKVIEKIKQNGKMGIYVNLIGSKAKQINDMIIEVELANKNSFAKQVLESHENKAELEKIVSIEAGKTMNIKFVSEGNNKKSESSSIENMITELDIPINIIDE